MDFDLVVACDVNGGIGKDGQLPWRLKHDQQYFKTVTTAQEHAGKLNAVIMGRKTWQSIPDKFRPLPGRINVVLSREENLSLPEGVYQAKSLDDALGLLNDLPVEKCFVIGGGYIYAEAIVHQRCRRLYVTEIKAKFDCDILFPDYKENFALISPPESVSEDGLDYSFCVYGKKNMIANQELQAAGGRK